MVYRQVLKDVVAADRNNGGGSAAFAATTSPPPVPSQGFFITLRSKEAANWTSHARQEIVKIAGATGISSVTTIFGEFNEEKYGPLIGQLDQVGLSLAHLAAWDAIIEQDIPGAWIFEDDVVAHQDFAALFPRYWATVPSDYEVIWLGHLPIYGSVACENALTTRLLHEDFVWCTHAMIVSRAGAERLSAAMRGILDMSIIAERVPNKYEVKIDLFINYIGEFFLPRSERHKWVVFDAAAGSMAAWGSHKWCRSTEFAMEEFNANGTCCETCDMDAVRAMTEVGVPLMGTGLVYQNLCKIDPWKLEEWKKEGRQPRIKNDWVQNEF